VLILAFDTATPTVTVALHDDRRVLAESSETGPVRHGELLTPGIAGVLREVGASPRDVTDIAVGVGPGPFTGLRVGVVTARTLGAALGVAVHGVCTLDVLAAAVRVAGPFLVATDARRKEVYWAAYSDPHTRVEGPAVARPADLATTGPVAGPGALLYPDDFPGAVPPQCPSAGVLARLVVDDPARHLDPEPLYLRRPDVAQPGQRKRVT
jgi:tRNA threonylcarbamoyladenosine biosynthesis protein TsaB